ncbi:MAG: glycosyltransferase family 4 protein [Flavobacteriales bacterium]|nr:glycosyltransferase family 4 protein [Flavobacteriales bacterium]
MVIRINGRFLTQPITGVQQFARRFSKYLMQQDDDIKIVTPSKSIISTDWKTIQTGKFFGHAWEQWSLPAYLKKQNHPLLINFCNTAPLNYQPQVITIHDLAFRHYPNTFHPLFSAYYNWLIPKIANKAIRIFTVSETMADEICCSFKIPSSNIQVIYNTAEIVSNTHTREKFILSVGTIQPRKNYRLMLDAFLKCSNDWQWVIVGGFSSNFHTDKALIYKLKTHPRIQLLNNIQEEELSLLYSKASVLISASFYEGYNLPVLEAIQHGCPVLISNIPVHRELYSGRAEFFEIHQSNAAATLAERINTYNLSYIKSPAPHQKFTMAVQGLQLWRALQKL